MLPLVLMFAALLAARFLVDGSTRSPVTTPAVNCIKGLFYLGMSVYEWRLMRAGGFVPLWFWVGGQIDTAGVEFLRQTPHPELDALYQAQAGYHLHSLFFAARNGAKPEMWAHHIVTLILLVLSHRMGYQIIGLLVLFLHDASDVPTAMAKGLLQLRPTQPLLALLLRVSLVAFWLSWAILRVCGLSRLIYDMAWHAIIFNERYMHGLVVFPLLLGSLVCMHIYWLSLLTRHLVQQVQAGSKKFMSDNSEVKDNGVTEEEMKARLAAEERALRAMSELAAKEEREAAAAAAAASSHSLRNRTGGRERHVDSIDLLPRQTPSS